MKSTKYNKPEFQYFIFDNSHQVLDYGVTERNEPKISNSAGMLKICISAGTNAVSCRYYKPDAKVISDWFSNSLVESKEIVAYLDYSVGPTKLIVQDIFYKSKYYREFKKEFSKKSTSPVLKAEFINQDTQLRITYITQQNDHEITETLNLT